MVCWKGEVIMMIDKDMLEAMGQLIKPINDRLDSMDKRMGTIEGELRTVKDDIQSLKADNAKLVTLEKKVDLILEGQQGINEKFQKLDKVAEDVEEIKVKVTALEEVTRSNTSQIKELRIAK